MKFMKKQLKGQEGFTLIEIIAVLIVLGVLAAVAVPRYLDVVASAKAKAGQGQVAEMKATLNLAYAKYYIATDGPPATAAALLGADYLDETSGTAFTVGTTPDDWDVTLTAATTIMTININDRGGDEEYAASGKWNVP